MGFGVGGLDAGPRKPDVALTDRGSFWRAGDQYFGCTPRGIGLLSVANLADRMQKSNDRINLKLRINGTLRRV